MKKITIFIIAIILSSFHYLFSQNSVEQSFQDSFQLIVDRYHEASTFPGLSAAVTFNEAGFWQGVSGFSHDEVAMDTSMLHGIASNTKLFTSIICLKMIEQGYFSLDDSLHSWLPNFEHVDPNITIRQLLRHESGLSDYVGNVELIPGQIVSEPFRIWEPEEIVAEIGAPWAEPGEIVAYSNINFILAAMVLESATDLEYVDLVRDSLILPLGLEDIYFQGYDSIPGIEAHPFLFGQDYADVPRIALGTLTWSAGSMVSRPVVINKWYNAIFNTDFLSESVKSNLLDFIDWPDNMDGDLMGMGVYDITHNGRKYYGHGGRTIGYSSYALYDVECGNSIFVVNNEIFSEARSLALELAEKACDLVNMETSISEAEDVEILNVFPNPADELIHLRLSENENDFDLLSLTDFSGSELYKVNLNKEKEIRIPSATLPNGVYVLRLSSSNQVIFKKIMVIH